MLARGEILARYEILCPIGSGGMATVYAARAIGEEAFEKLVALKLMLPHLAGDEKFVRMFVDEARLAAQVQSPFVVGTIDLGREPDRGLLFQVLELVLGASLRQVLDAQADRGGPLPLDVALAILVQAARGLADAHAARGPTGAPLELVHRDVSPHNVLVGLDGRARISDFGVARAAARVAQTESGELKGKLAYSAPEQLRGEAAEPRSDVFSLGVVAWEALAGRRLFEGDNPLAIVDQMVRRPIPDVREARPEVPADVATVVASALERDLGARLASAAELADRLERAASQAGLLASQGRVAEVVRDLVGERVSRLERTIAEHLAMTPARSVARRTPAIAPAVPGEPASPETAESGAETKPPRRVWAAVGAVLVLAIGAGVAFVLAGGSGTGAEAETGALAETETETETGTATEAEALAESETGALAETDAENEVETDPLAEAETETAAGSEAAEGERRRSGGRSGRRAEGRGAGAPPPSETTTVATPPPSPPPPTPPPPAEPAAPRQQPQRGGSLLGLDAFDRDDGKP